MGMKDTIYREDAINAVEEALKNVFVEPKGLGEKIINPLPSAERTSWSPCSEGLPKKYGEYLCCNIRGEYIIGMPFEDEDSDTGFAVETDNEYMIDCIAWMPLPKPYKRGVAE